MCPRMAGERGEEGGGKTGKEERRKRRQREGMPFVKATGKGGRDIKERIKA